MSCDTQKKMGSVNDFTNGLKEKLAKGANERIRNHPHEDVSFMEFFQMIAVILEYYILDKNYDPPRNPNPPVNRKLEFTQFGVELVTSKQMEIIQVVVGKIRQWILTEVGNVVYKQSIMNSIYTDAALRVRYAIQNGLFLLSPSPIRKVCDGVMFIVYDYLDSFDIARMTSVCHGYKDFGGKITARRVAALYRVNNNGDRHSPNRLDSDRALDVNIWNIWNNNLDNSDI